MTSKDLNYIGNLQFWGNDDAAVSFCPTFVSLVKQILPLQILEKAKNEDPSLYEKMMRFLEKYNKLSQKAKNYIDEVILGQIW